jgi:2Fe-2S ferredoxin
VIKVIFVEPDGARREVFAKPGTNLMQCAIDNMIPGVDGICGGCCSCATCHAYVCDEWMPAAGVVSGEEDAMLDSVDQRKPGSRLLCQLKLASDLDGIVVYLMGEDE